MIRLSDEFKAMHTWKRQFGYYVELVDSTDNELTYRDAFNCLSSLSISLDKEAYERMIFASFQYAYDQR